MNQVNQNLIDFGSPISISSTESENTKRRLGHFSATDSDTDNASSTMTTPKESSRKLVFHNSGETPPGHDAHSCCHARFELATSRYRVRSLTHYASKNRGCDEGLFFRYSNPGEFWTPLQQKGRAAGPSGASRGGTPGRGGRADHPGVERSIGYRLQPVGSALCLAKSWTRTFLIMCAEPLRRTMCSCAVPNMCP